MNLPAIKEKAKEKSQERPKDKTRETVKEKAVRWFIYALSQLTLPTAQAMGRIFGTLLYWFPSETKKTIQKNIRVCFPSLRTREQNRLIHQSFINTLITAFEAGPVWLQPIEHGQSFIQGVSGEPLLNKALESSQGVLLILPHLGNWEMTNQYTSQKTQVTAMYKPAKIKILEDIVFKARTRAGANMVPADRSGVIKTYRCLKKGGTSVILPDQEPDNGIGFFSNFFGTPALTGNLVPRLIKETQAIPLIIFCKRLPYSQKRPKGSHFEICIRKVADAVHHEDNHESIHALNSCIEASIQECIEQYQWSYKRFKTRPAGEPGRFYRSARTLS